MLEEAQPQEESPITRSDHCFKKKEAGIKTASELLNTIKRRKNASAAKKVREEEMESGEESQVPEECSMCGCDNIVRDDKWRWLGCEECKVWVPSHCVGVHLKVKLCYFH